MPPSTDLLQGTLDVLILRTLALEQLHGRTAAVGPSEFSDRIGARATGRRLMRIDLAAFCWCPGRNENGKTLWRFPTNIFMKASLLRLVDGKRCVVVAACPNILCFSL
jgi:hypothetical protein